MERRSRQRGSPRLALAVVGLTLAITPVASTAAMAAAAPTSPATAIDTSFGGGVMTPSFSARDDEAFAVAVQPDGAVIVAGKTNGDGHTAPEPDPSDLLVARYTVGGQLDTTFGDGGRFVLDSGGTDVANGVAIQPDGKIVVVGMYGVAPSAVLRLTPSGQLDPSFHGGLVTFPSADTTKAVTIAQAVAIQPDGKIVMTGGPDADLTRLNADGSLDDTFGQHGFVPWPSPAGTTALSIGPDGTIVVVGTYAPPVFSGGPSDYAAVARFTSEGVLDASFGDGGMAFADFDTDLVDRGFRVTGVVVQPDLRVVVAGNAYIFGMPAAMPVPGHQMPPPVMQHVGLSDVALIRLLPDGHLDPTFAGTGKVHTNVPGIASPARVRTDNQLVSEGDSAAMAVALDGAGRILVAGRSSQPFNQPFAARYTAAGLLDPTFGEGGVVVADVHQQYGWADAMAIDGTGRIVLAGMAQPGYFVPGVYKDLFLARIVPGTSDGSVWAWGWNVVGQLGDGTGVDRAAPVKVPGLSGVVAVSAGSFHTLALRGDGTVWAWGWNAYGQLGDGTTTERRTPVQVPGLAGVVAVSAGGLHSLALRGDGTVWAWGWNGAGQLGDGTTVDHHAPAQVVGLEHATSVSAGLYHSAAVREDGFSWAWGWNAVGQLGDGTTIDRHQPVVAPVPPSQSTTYPITDVSAGGLDTMIVAPVGAGGAGWDGVNQLDIVSSGVLRVSAGTYHTLTLSTDGSVRAAGWNAAGQLGDGTTITRRADDHTPAVAAPPAWAISAGGYHSFALTPDRQVWAWGWNGVGQLGTGSLADSHVPVHLATIDNVATISAGAGHSVAIRA